MTAMETLVGDSNDVGAELGSGDGNICEHTTVICEFLLIICFGFKITVSLTPAWSFL